MITIKLDRPLRRGKDKVVEELVVETPLMARHVFLAQRKSQAPNDFGERFCEVVCGLQTGEVDQLTLEDYCKLQEVLLPLMAPFNRLSQVAKA